MLATGFGSHNSQIPLPLDYVLHFERDSHPGMAGHFQRATQGKEMDNHPLCNSCYTFSYSCSVLKASINQHVLLVY